MVPSGRLTAAAGLAVLLFLLMSCGGGDDPADSGNDDVQSIDSCVDFETEGTALLEEAAESSDGEKDRLVTKLNDRADSLGCDMEFVSDTFTDITGGLDP